MQKVFEIEIEGGKKVGFRFGMKTNGRACRIEGGISLTELFSRLGLTGTREPDFESLGNFFFASAQVYAESKNEPIDFTSADVSDWLDSIGLEKAMNMMSVAFSAPKTDESKNEQAPMTGQ